MSQENTLAPHQARVVDEKTDLDEKLSKLQGFFATDLFKSLPDEGRDLLVTQLGLMQAYSEVLAQRIDRF